MTERSRGSGWIHEMVGVSLPMSMETYHLYHAQINEILRAADLPPTRGLLRAALHQRVQLDVEAQIASHARCDGEIASTFSPHWMMPLQKAGNLADTLRYTFQVLGDIRWHRCLPVLAARRPWRYANRG